MGICLLHRTWATRGKLSALYRPISCGHSLENPSWEERTVRPHFSEAQGQVEAEVGIPADWALALERDTNGLVAGAPRQVLGGTRSKFKN